MASARIILLPTVDIDIYVSRIYGGKMLDNQIRQLETFQ